tara:strand:- start:701 stop:1927 length:1227 start_codon:yes stop_codon:yes gene_type:complete
MIFDYITLAFKNLSRRKVRSWLTLIGIIIGIAAVISLIGLGEGLRVAITSQFGLLGNDVLSVRASGIDFAGPPGTNVPNPLSDELYKEINNVKGVETAFNRDIETVLMKFNDKKRTVTIASSPEGENRKIFEKILNLKVEEGRLLKDSDLKKIVIGNNFGKEDDFGKAIKVGSKVEINDIVFQVIGRLEKKGSFLIDNSLIANEKDIIKTLDRDDGTPNIIAVKVKNVNEINSVKENIEQLLRKERNVKKGEENFIVQSPVNAIESLNSTLFAVQLFITIIATISLLVGGIGIMNTMYTSVLERTKEIGIMKAIGAKNSEIFEIFFIESGFLGMAGGIIGLLIGATIAFTSAHFGRIFLGNTLIQAEISLFVVIGSLLFSFILGIIFGVLPAIQASRLQPVDSLRRAK